MKPGEEVTVVRVIARLNVGGPALQTILMSRALQGRGYRTLLLIGEVADGEASMEYLALEKGVLPIKISTMSRGISSIKDMVTLWRLIRLLRREKPSIIHTHTAKAGALGRIAAILTGVPIRVHTFHGHVFYGYFSPRVTRMFLMIERFLARHTDCIVAISELQKRDLCEVYKIAPADKIAMIPLGFDLDPFLQISGSSESLRHEIGSTPGRPLVGWVGRLTGIKSPLSLIDCAERLKEHPGKPQFVMVGDGELRNDCELRIKQNNLTGVVFLTGWRRDLPSIYAALDFVVSTSLNEGTPLALLEAMAAGRPVISTNVGGVRDLMVGERRSVEGLEIFENGILVNCEVSNVSRAIRHLIENPDLTRSMGKAGREFVTDTFSQARLAEDLDQLYRSLLTTKLDVRGSFAFGKNEAGFHHNA